jgi:hypothetical protein
MFFANILKFYVRKIGVCVRKMEKVNSLVKKIYLTIYYINNLLIHNKKFKTLLFALIETPDPENSKNREVK